MLSGRLAIVVLLAAGATGGQGQPTAPSADEFARDFKALWEAVDRTYAYFDQKSIRWDDVPRLYEKDLAAVRSTREFVGVLERVLEELYDHHAHLTANTTQSPQLVPSGADLWAEWIDDRAVVEQVRPGSAAAQAGIAAGAVIEAIDGVGIQDAVERRIGRAVDRSAPDVRNWALRALLAGIRNQDRRIRFVQAGAGRLADLPPVRPPARGSQRVSARRLTDSMGYVRFNDSLGELDTVTAFDAALQELRDTAALIVDLRDTPGGGNSTVARGILGRFVEREQPYQKHELPVDFREHGIRRSWLELVSPRGPFTYTGPVVVLVDRWTGSMGEGMAIALDAIRSAPVVGTRMAGLLGATYTMTLPHTKIGANIPAEKLFHVNGTPRESFRPTELVDMTAASRGDVILERGIATLQRLIAR